MNTPGVSNRENSLSNFQNFDQKFTDQRSTLVSGLDQMNHAAAWLGKDRFHSVLIFPAHVRQPAGARRENLWCGREPCFHCNIRKFVCHKGTSGTRWNASLPTVGTIE